MATRAVEIPDPDFRDNGGGCLAVAIAIAAFVSLAIAAVGIGWLAGERRDYDAGYEAGFAAGEKAVQDEAIQAGVGEIYKGEFEWSVLDIRMGEFP